MNIEHQNLKKKTTIIKNNKCLINVKKLLCESDSDSDSDDANANVIGNANANVIGNANGNINANCDANGDANGNINANGNTNDIIIDTPPLIPDLNLDEILNLKI